MRILSIRRPRPDRYRFLAALAVLEQRLTPAIPATPVIIEPFTEHQITGTFDINMQTDPAQYFDPDGDAWNATEWVIRTQGTHVVVWETGFLEDPPLTLYRVDFSDGMFVGPLAGQTELPHFGFFQLVVRYRDSNNEISMEAVRNFRTAAATEPVPGSGTWLVRSGYVVEPVQTGLRLPVNIAFVPNPGDNPEDPLYFVNELYGSIQVVRRDGQRQTFATGLLDYNPEGPISGSGEQGLTGLAVERDANNPNIYHLYVGMLWDNGSPPGGPNHYPKVERLTSVSGGLSLASRTVLLNMQPEIQGQSHQISNVSIGPDGKLYVHMGDGFAAGTGLDLDQFRGKVLRMNKDGTPVATGDPAGANPFYDPTDGINARDYIYTYGHRNPFGGAWRAEDGRLWIVENGNSLDRMVDLVPGQSYGWAGDDNAIIQYSKYNWNPSASPVNIDFVESTKFGGSMFPAESNGHAFVSLSGSTYAAGPWSITKSIVEFPDLTTLDMNGKLAVPPIQLVRYNGTGRASVVGLAAGPDGLYFSDFYEDTGLAGPTAIGANIYRVRYVGNVGGELPTVAVPAAATPNPLFVGSSTNLTVLGEDDGGESNLIYTWIMVGSPPGPVTFSDNGSNSAKNVTATFVVNGTYNFLVSIRDAGGQSTFSNVTVMVASLLSDTGNGITGQYFDNIDFTNLFQTRVDPGIFFYWNLDAPIPGMGPDEFSVRWTGYIVPRFSETYTFYTTTDDGVRLWVDDMTTPIIDKFIDQGATTWTGTVTLTANTLYPIRMDYYENGGFASAQLEWSSASQPRVIIPQGRFYSTLPTVPNAPTNLQLIAASANQINLSWTDNSNNEQGFRIQRSTDGVNFTNIATAPANVTMFQDVGLLPGTLYFYRVLATNPAGDSSFITANLPTRPGIPTGFAVLPGDGQVQLNWNVVPGAATYRVYRYTSPSQPLGTPLASGLTMPTYLDSTVTNGTTYFYRITAVNAGGEGQPSEETAAIPNVANPPSVASVQIDDGTAQRSQVRHLVVTFGSLVNFGDGAFVLTDLLEASVPNVTVGLHAEEIGGVTHATLTFSGSAVVNGSLPDGRFRLTIVAGHVTAQQSPFSPMSGNYVVEFHRLFGDSNGDAVVSAVDLNAFRLAYATGPSIFDFDGDGATSAFDFNQFRLRYGFALIP
jgi:glucose/arabinose dehydrogenase